MKSNITDTYIDTFDCGYTETLLKCSGQITECTSKRVGSGYKFAVTNLIVLTIGGYRMLTVALPVGMQLYNYINTEQRRNRMDKIRFEFIVHIERQQIKSYKAFDPEGWIGDALELERMCPRREIG